MDATLRICRLQTMGQLPAKTSPIPPLIKTFLTPSQVSKLRFESDHTFCRGVHSIHQGERGMQDRCKPLIAHTSVPFHLPVIPRTRLLRSLLPCNVISRISWSHGLKVHFRILLLRIQTKRTARTHEITASTNIRRLAFLSNLPRAVRPTMTRR